MVQGKTKSYSYKVKKRIPLPREEWTIVPNTHEAIIDYSTFKLAQDMMNLKSKPMKKKRLTTPSILNGLLICANCGEKMQRTITNKKNGDYFYYSCSSYKKQGKSACTAHLVEESVVINTILVTLNTIINNMVSVEDAMKRNNEQLIKKAIGRVQNQIDVVDVEFNKLTKAKGFLYTDYTNGDISESDYRFMKTDFETKCSDLLKRKERLYQELNEYKENDLFNNPVISTYTKYKGIEKLDRRVLVSLIDSILVDENNSIKIIFKFRDEIKKYQFKNL